MTKEEILAQLIMLNGFKDASVEKGIVNSYLLDKSIDKLNRELVKAKSIEDLQREAFEAGRTSKKYTELQLSIAEEFQYDDFDEFLETRDY